MVRATWRLAVDVSGRRADMSYGARRERARVHLREFRGRHTYL